MDVCVRESEKEKVVWTCVSVGVCVVGICVRDGGERMWCGRV